MLDNDPPPGTQVRFTREIRKARANDFAKLTRSFGPYDPERPTDEFEVEFNGERYRVQRRDIEKAVEQRSS
jgi:hypothetical protein